VIEHHGEVSELVSQPPTCLANEAREELKDELVLGHEDGLEDWRLLQQEETVVTPRGYKLDSESWHTGMEYYMACFHLLPQDMAKPCHNEESVWAFIECETDLQKRLGWKPNYGSDTRHPIRDLVFWNRRHKSGGLVWACGTELANSYWSDSPKSAMAQWQAHDADSCMHCRMRGKRTKAASADEED
jgi:hypothetical protein